MKITPERLAEIEAREKAATPGKWKQPPHDPRILNVGRKSLMSVNDEDFGCFYDEADATFCRHARTDIPDLIAEVREQWERLAKQQTAFCSYCGQQTNREGVSVEDFNALLLEHITTCEKRPEVQMGNVICALALSLGVDIEAIPKGDPAALIDAFDVAWQRLCDGRDNLISDLREAREPKWTCFHCGFETKDQAEAMAHFGDDMHEPLALCQHWLSWADHEKVHEYQQLTMELNGEREESEKQRKVIEALEYRLGGLENIIDSRFPGCRTIDHQIFHRYDTLEGEKLVALEQLEQQTKRADDAYNRGREDGASKQLEQLEEAKSLLKPFADEVSAQSDKDERSLLIESRNPSRYEDCSHMKLDLTMGNLRAAAKFLDGK